MPSWICVADEIADASHREQVAPHW